MKIIDFRNEIVQHNLAHPELSNCIYPKCLNKINPAWDNMVLCLEHQMLMEYWFYEEDGAKYCPDVRDFPSGKKLPKTKGSDKDMSAYRKRYCDWIGSLSTEEYMNILLHQID